MKHTPRKRFGQNFLVDRSIIARIVGAIDPQPTDNLVEIGPGLGALTVPLLERVPRLQVIELDRDLAARLRADYPPERVVVHEGDAARFDFSTLAAPLRIVGNLPYNISTPLLFHLLSQRHVIHDMHFMLQKEVVDRLGAEPGNKEYGRLSVMMQYLCEVQPLFDVPAEAFDPAPKVTSAIVRLVPHHGQNPFGETTWAAMDTLLRCAFHARRKTLRNNLKALLTDAQMQNIDTNWSLRPEQLSVAEYVHLCQQLPADIQRQR